MNLQIITITASILSAIFLILLLVGSYGARKNVEKRIRYYRLLIWTCIVGLIVDSIAHILDITQNAPDIVLIIFNYLSYILVDILFTVYSFYLYSLIKEKQKSFTKIYSVAVACLALMDIVFLTVGTITKNLFIIENHKSVQGPWADYIFVGPLICIIFIFIVLMIQSKVLGRKYVLALSIYLAIPLVAAIVQIFFKDLEIGYVGSALSMLTVYVIIQSESMVEASVRAKIYDVMSKQDVLTGLKNRRGYDEVMDSIPKDKVFGVVFCDINELKCINDTCGHEKGDELIKKLANILVQSFPHGQIFRISGDEFVVLLDDIEGFGTVMTMFGSKLEDNDKIASFGYAKGKGSEIYDLIREAEKMMYSNKQVYYLETGKDRRQ